MGIIKTIGKGICGFVVIFTIALLAILVTQTIGCDSDNAIPTDPIVVNDTPHTAIEITIIEITPEPIPTAKLILEQISISTKVDPIVIPTTIPTPIATPIFTPTPKPLIGCDNLDPKILKMYDVNGDGLIDNDWAINAIIDFENMRLSQNGYDQIKYAYEHKCLIQIDDPTPIPTLIA